MHRLVKMGATCTRLVVVGASASLAAASGLPTRPLLAAVKLRALPRFSSARACATSASSSPEAGLTNIYGLRDAELHSLLAEWGQPKFRVKQLKSFLYDKGVDDFDAMHNLPKALRQRLREHTTLGEMCVETEQHSRDGTRKRLWRCADGSLIESVLMPYADKRRTACISSQVGCAMGCTFCATGQMGFKRDLSEAEIFEQAARFSAELKAKDEVREGRSRHRLGRCRSRHH